MEQLVIPLLPLLVFLQETVALIFSTCTRVEKLTPHSLSPGQVCFLGTSLPLAQRVVIPYSFSLCVLCDLSAAGVNISWRIRDRQHIVESRLATLDSSLPEDSDAGDVSPRRRSSSRAALIVKTMC